MTEPNGRREIQFKVQGMTWVSWEAKVVKALEGLNGVERAEASHPEKSAIVIYNPALVSPEQMQQVLLKSGYVASIVGNKNQNQDILKSFPDGKNEFQNSDLVCFCFGYTRNDIEQDYIKNGQSMIMAKITAEKKRGGCDCANKNPKGRWCLVDVRQVVDRVKEVRGWKSKSWEPDAPHAILSKPLSKRRFQKAELKSRL